MQQRIKFLGIAKLFLMLRTNSTSDQGNSRKLFGIPEKGNRFISIGIHVTFKISTINHGIIKISLKVFQTSIQIGWELHESAINFSKMWNDIAFSNVNFFQNVSNKAN